ncbi:hypothetical protein V1460_26120 [Streptomyces sp. SCSIO 30461]|uniref:hypothetical protein n=1 Tax=Streptomyces sp. SCSIO 30461 TaxID=3118085 RepID=UPI0030D379BA
MGLSAHRSPRTAAGAHLVTCVLMAAVACSPAGRNDAGASGSPTAPAPDTPVEICTGLVTYWVEEALKGNKWAGLDWEQKGLSNEQLEVHDAVLADARAEEKRNGRAAAVAWLRREVSTRCTARNGATGSSENWRLTP